MNNKGFFIKKISASGTNATTSDIDFRQGLNIIFGPSNTGKSYVLSCIDYLFGGNQSPINSQKEYDTISMAIETYDGKEIRFSRKIDTNEINVSSNVGGIDSKSYKIGSSEGKKNYGDIFLKLIGIDERPRIYTSQNYKANDLTWRTFLHTFYLQEEDIIKKETILKASKFPVLTKTLSALLFLLSGKDLVDSEERETPEIKKAKRAAIASYINDKLFSTGDRLRDLEVHIKNFQGEDYEAVISILIDELDKNEQEIIDAHTNSRALLKRIYQLSSDLEEAYLLQERYAALFSQYSADKERLYFIIDAENNKPETDLEIKCPLCNNDVTLEDHTPYHNAVDAEDHLLNIRLDDLKGAQQDLDQEIADKEKEMHVLSERNKQILNTISKSLEPKSKELKDKIAEAREKQNLATQIEVMRDLIKEYNNDLSEQEIDPDKKAPYEPKKLFSKEEINALNEYLEHILKNANYLEYSTSRVSMDKFDVVVNGKEKGTHGKGFRAFLNSAHAFIWMKLLSVHAKYSPKLLVLDSPILSLKEKGNEMMPGGMKHGLFTYFVENQQFGQVIIAENELPDLDYKDANLIEFTMDKARGRYGFLLDVTND